jgi:hypothetical protein
MRRPESSALPGRTDHSAVLLGNGDAMVVGGYDGSGGNIEDLSSAELFHYTLIPDAKPRLTGS